MVSIEAKRTSIDAMPDGKEKDMARDHLATALRIRTMVENTEQIRGQERVALEYERAALYFEIASLAWTRPA